MTEMPLTARIRASTVATGSSARCATIALAGAVAPASAAVASASSARCPAGPDLARSSRRLVTPASSNAECTVWTYRSIPPPSPREGQAAAHDRCAVPPWRAVLPLIPVWEHSLAGHERNLLDGSPLNRQRRSSL